MFLLTFDFLPMWMQNNLYKLIFGFILLILYFFGKNLRSRYFAWFMHKFSQTAGPKYHRIKQELFKPLQDHVSQIPEFRKKNLIKILEIGVGTGVNFQFFPDGCHLIVIDTNPWFNDYYNANRQKFKNIHSEEIIICAGEDMNMVAENSVDIVICTLVLCSVGNIEQVLKQILRVLVPGGKFYFMEHIKEFNVEKHWIRTKVQEFLTVSRIWPVLFDGCCLNRDTLSMIEKTGFSKVKAERTHNLLNKLLFSVIEPTLHGSATK